MKNRNCSDKINIPLFASRESEDDFDGDEIDGEEEDSDDDDDDVNEEER